MWPMRPEMTRDECRKCLRCLELDAYGSMVSVLRAQGPFTNEKQKLLQELAKVLHISNERHRAEVRRAVNDEKLTTIAEQLNGPNTGIDWTLEGRRTIPLLPRLKARSAFTTLANSLSLTTAIANEKKPERRDTIRQSRNSTAAETESHPNIKMEENSSINTKLNNFENELNNSKTSQENSNMIEDERKDDKDVLNKVNETPKELSRKRKSPSPLPMAPPNKVLVVSDLLNHTPQTLENKQTPQALQVTKCQNYALITVTDNEISDSKESTTALEHPNECTTVPLNKHVVAVTSMCTSNASNPKTVVSTDQNKISTKVVPAITSCVLSINKVHSNKDTQPQDSTNGTQKTQMSDNTNSNPPSVKSSIMPIIATRVSNSRLTQSMPVYPGTTVSSGPGPPQVKQVPIALMCQKLPSEQITTIDHQSTAKTSIFPQKIVNMPHYTNTKLNKANVIVIQKAKAVTLSHAGKEVVGKVIMGGKNLCVTSQHNANSINVQPHHISLNNGDQTKTMLPITNSSQNAESVKTNIKPGKAAVVLTRLRHDIPENKVLSQLFDSPAILNVESKTVIQDVNAHLPKEKCNSDKDTINQESSLRTDSITSEEKQHRINNDVNASMNSQTTNLLDSLKPLGNKEILVRLKEVNDDNKDDIRKEKSNENMDVFDVTLESTNKNSQSFQYPVDNNKNCNLEKSSRSIMTTNQMNEHDDS
ncbi:BRCA2-interacting transcriptional repressor EMSY isoform X1 [Solenopsis invicta]|uniref:BRCA2-interacting transcriptional repressor EMSY isoform X1 n=1 Tax=Solenopsis invicta TaxID=13686 RepID=UPI000595CDF8|nr:BRCA2-interacting transcriptional repressor EMSY isoform X1 [Solenopsis invicta]XP_039308069.1 BRCA2-interacting transcriptional repressor EMSY isoform X1 [Solenopsis invicta]